MSFTVEVAHFFPMMQVAQCCEQLQWSNKLHVAALRVHVAVLMLRRTRAPSCGILHGVTSQFLLFVSFVQSLVHHRHCGVISMSFAFRKNIFVFTFY